MKVSGGCVCGCTVGHRPKGPGRERGNMGKQPNKPSKRVVYEIGDKCYVLTTDGKVLRPATMASRGDCSRLVDALVAGTVRFEEGG